MVAISTKNLWITHNRHRTAVDIGDGPRIGGVCARAVSNPASGGGAGAGRSVYRGLARIIMTRSLPNHNSYLQISAVTALTCTEYVFTRLDSHTDT